MSEIIMNNVKTALSSSRIDCPGLSEDVYALTDYMSICANETLVPQGMLMCLVLCLEDIKKGECSFAKMVSPFPQHLVTHKIQVLAQAVYIPQIIDALADADFAEEFRILCKEILNFDPPSRQKRYDVNADIKENFPQYVKVAVNWWANAIVNPKFDNGDDSMAGGGMAFLMAMMVNTKKNISNEQIKIFKEELAILIMAEMTSSYSCCLSVDYNPDCILSAAAEKAGINNNMGFPWKTSMNVSKDKVSVWAGYGASEEILWQIS